jgi:flavin-dependent dehydrogenase
MVRAESIDALVLGAGPAGSAVACCLAQAGARVLLVGRAGYLRSRHAAAQSEASGKRKAPGKNLGETLPPDVKPLVARLARLACDDAAHLRSPGTRTSWGSDTPHENHYLFSPHGESLHLDRPRFDAALVEQATTQGADFVHGARLISATRSTGCWQVELRIGQKILTRRCQWIVDATGRAASFARRQGARRIRFDRLIAVVGQFPSVAEDIRAQIEARRTGWWYSALAPGGHAAATFFTDYDLATLRAGGHARFWQQQFAVSALTRNRFGFSLPRETEIRTVAASTTLLNPVIAAGWLAVGDAACTIDPLSSQGIAWALASGIEAARTILDARNAKSATRYEACIRERFRNYLRERRAWYTRETRWPDSPFWQRRQRPAALRTNISTFAPPDSSPLPEIGVHHESL